jgi:hypothetical protein
MHCPNCGDSVEVPLHDELRLVPREDDAKYLILAKGRTGTRLVHECELRGDRT